MKVYLEWNNLSEILQAKSSLQMWWYKWEINVVLTAWLEEDIKKEIYTIADIKYPPSNIWEIFWMKLIPDIPLHIKIA